MFEVRYRSDGYVLRKFEKLSEAKKYAEKAAQDLGKPFDVFKVKQVWTTETIDEALKY